jgi:hypothetical protein
MGLEAITVNGRAALVLSVLVFMAACEREQTEIRWGEILQEQHIAPQRLFALRPIRTAQSCMENTEGPPTWRGGSRLRPCGPIW